MHGGNAHRWAAGMLLGGLLALVTPLMAQQWVDGKPVFHQLTVERPFQADRSVCTDGAGMGVPFAGVYNETYTAPTEDQTANLRSTSARGLHANLRDAAGNEIVSATGAPGGTDRGLVVRIAGGAAGDGKILDGAAAGEADVIGIAPTTEQGVVVRNIPSGTQTVSGTVTSTQGTAAAGSGAWPFTVTNTIDTVVKPGDSTNNAVRVNVVAGGAGDGKILDGTAAGQADVMSSAPAGTEEGLVTRNVPSGTQTVAGTVTANAGTGTFTTALSQTGTNNDTDALCTQAGTWTVQPGNTANTTAWLTRGRATDGTNDETTLFDLDSGVGNQYARGVSLRKIASGGSVEAGTAADPLRVDVTGTTTQPVSGTVTANAGTNLNTSALALDATIGRAIGSTTAGQTGPLVQGAVTTGAPTYTTAQTDPLSLRTTGSLRTEMSEWIGSLAPTVGQKAMASSIPVVIASDQTAVPTSQSGTWTMQPGNTANTTPWLVAGGAAHSAAVAGNPVFVAAYAEADAAALDSSTVVEGDATRVKADLEGRLLVNVGHPNRFLATAINSTATVLTQIHAAPGAGLSLYITSVASSASVASTTTVDQYPVLKYGTGTNCATGTTVVWAAFTAANGGVTSTFADPIKLPAVNALCFMHAVAGNKHVVVQGYTAP